MEKSKNRISPSSREIIKGIRETRRRSTMNSLLWGVIITCGCVVILLFLINTINPPPIPQVDVQRMAIGTIVFLVCASGVMLLNRFISSLAASIIFSLSLAAAFFATDSLDQVLQGRSLLFFVLPLVVSSLLIHPWAGYAVALIISLATTYYATILHGGVPNFPALTLFFLMAYIIHQSINKLESAMAQEQKNNRLLAESEQRYRKIIETSPSAMAIINLQGILCDCNPAFLKAYGTISKEEVIGLDSSHFVHPDEQARLAETMAALLEQGTISNLEWKGLRKDGSSYITEFSASIIPDWEGKPASFFCTFQDITERKKLENEMRQSEERFRELIESSSDIIAIIGRDNTISYVSPSMERLLGYKLDEVIGQNIFDYIHPEDLDIAAAALRPGIPQEAIGPMLVLRLRNKNGTWSTLEVVGKAMYDHPAIHGTIVNCRSITEQKQVEAELRKSNQLLESTLASISDAVFVFDAQTSKILECNPAASRIFGYERGEMLGRVPTFLHVDDAARNELRSQMDRAIQERGHFSHFEYPMKRKDGTIISTEHSVSQLHDPLGRHTGWVSVVHDITDRKQAEAELRESEVRYHHLIDLLPIGVGIHQNGMITLLNPYGTKLMGAETQDGLLGKSFIDFIAPDYRESVMMRIKESSSKNTKTELREEKFIREDGTTFDVEVSARPFGSTTDGTMLVAFNDITTRKQAEVALRESEEKFAKAFHANPAPMSIIDTKGCYLEINQAFEKNFGYSRAEVIGKTSLELGLVESPETYRQSTTLFSEKGHLENYEIKVRTRTGEILYGLLFVEEVMLNGESCKLTLTLDITERKQTQEAINRQNQQIQDISRKLIEVQEQEKHRLASELHDDLGQSLTSLKLMLELGSRAHSTASRDQKLSEARELVSELTDKVRNISLDLRPSILDDFGLFAALRWLFGRFESQTGIVINCSNDLESKQRLEPIVETAAFRIIQEALTNIARHASTREAQVNISLEKVLSIEIVDEGIGFNVGKTMQTEADSAGLSGMQERARLLGGHLEILSEPGSGTRILAEIPLAGGE